MAENSEKAKPKTLHLKSEVEKDLISESEKNPDRANAKTLSAATCDNVACAMDGDLGGGGGGADPLERTKSHMTCDNGLCQQ